MFLGDNDFNTSVITVIFSANENQDNPRRIQPANIMIVDDAVDEAQEQKFIAFLQVKDAIKPSLIDNTLRNISICTIIDNESKCFKII